MLNPPEPPDRVLETLMAPLASGTKGLPVKASMRRLGFQRRTSTAWAVARNADRFPVMRIVPDLSRCHCSRLQLCVINIRGKHGSPPARHPSTLQVSGSL